LNWNYHNPVAVRFGWDALEALPELLRGRRAVLVTFPEAAQSGLRPRLTRLLGTQVTGIIEDIEPNPEVSWFRARYAAFWKEHHDCVVIAVGGGSVIDTAKLLQVGVAERDFEAYFDALRAGRQPRVARALPLVAVPTTAGTGSEVTPWATLWDRSSESPKKYSLHVAQTWPEAALVDPALTLSAPPGVMRNSALDALSHSLESIWNVNHNPVSDALAVAAARGVIATLPALLDAPERQDLRIAMSRARLLAGLAFSNTRTALAHSVSYEMTLLHGLPHGLACSFTLPLVWSLAAGADAGRDAVLGQVFGGAADAGSEALTAFLHRVGVATRFADHGVTLSTARAMVAAALEGARGRNFIHPSPRLDAVEEHERGAVRAGAQL
jgi:phosphonate metabolism-associated iron-containing alcohol dehydrogenase